MRKDSDGTHSAQKKVEGWFGFKSYIVIDDLIATGTTLKIIQREMRDQAKARNVEPPCMVGFYLYNLDELKWRGDGTNYSYYDRYFIFPDVTEKIPNKPTLSEQVAFYASARPCAGYLTY